MITNSAMVDKTKKKYNIILIITIILSTVLLMYNVAKIIKFWLENVSIIFELIILIFVAIVFVIALIIYQRYNNKIKLQSKNKKVVLLLFILSIILLFLTIMKTIIIKKVFINEIINIMSLQETVIDNPISATSESQTVLKQQVKFQKFNIKSDDYNLIASFSLNKQTQEATCGIMFNTKRSLLYPITVEAVLYSNFDKPEIKEELEISFPNIYSSVNGQITWLVANVDVSKFDIIDGISLQLLSEQSNFLNTLF